MLSSREKVATCNFHWSIRCIDVCVGVCVCICICAHVCTFMSVCVLLSLREGSQIGFFLVMSVIHVSTRMCVCV